MNRLKMSLMACGLSFVLTACQTSGFGGGNVSNLAYAPHDLMTPIAVAAKQAPETAATTTVKEIALAPTARPTEAEKAVNDLSTLAKRRRHYAPLVAKHAKANGMPVDFVMAMVEVESNFKVDALGTRGEIGLMQLLPRTARYIGYKGRMKDLYDPETNLTWGMKYLSKAHRLGGGSTCGTILKYNAGHAAKKMNKVSRKYCTRVRRIMRTGKG